MASDKSTVVNFDQEKLGFEKVFELVGGHGKFQWTLMLVLSLHVMFLSWNHMGYIFIGAVPDHWCAVDELDTQTNWTSLQIKELSIPKYSQYLSFTDRILFIYFK